MTKADAMAWGEAHRYAPDMLKLATILWGAWLVVLSVGCDGSPPTSGTMVDPVDGVRWPFWPRRMQVHRLSRVVIAGSPADVTIEARIEFADVDGHSTRAVGELILELHDATPDVEDTLILTWNVNLRDEQVNRRRFDQVTRTYLFPLQTERSELPELVELRAGFTSDDGWIPPSDRLLMRTRIDTAEVADDQSSSP